MPRPTLPSAALVVACLFSILASGSACGGGSDAADTVGVRIGELRVEAELALTPDVRGPGLGNRDSMARDRGMLFVFPQEAEHGFWMKDMRFSLDFVWISAERRVVNLTLDVPPPAPGTPDTALGRLRPGAPVLYVLEVNAGVVAEAGVAVGEAVTFEGEVPPGE